MRKKELGLKNIESHWKKQLNVLLKTEKNWFEYDSSGSLL